MPLSFVIDRELRVMFVRGSGIVTENDFRLVQKEFRAEAQAADLGRVLDLMDVTELQVSSEAIRKLAEIGREIPGRRVFITASAEAFGVARMFEQNLRLPEGMSLVCTSVADAFEFLGLPRDTQWPTG